MAGGRIGRLDADQDVDGVALAGAQASAAGHQADGGCKRKVGIHGRSPDQGRRTMFAGHSLK